MCIAIFKPENVVLSEETLKQCWKNNPHGGGFMYAEEGKLHVVKGLMDYRDFREAYRPHQKKRVVLHFRIASIGAVNEENTHPYVIRPGKLAFVHNGTIYKVAGTRGSGASDTSHFNEEYLKQLPPSFLQSSGMLHLIEDFIGRSKLIFMDNEGEVVIVNAEAGEVKDLVWYSNDSYKAEVSKPPSHTQEWDSKRKTYVKKEVSYSSSQYSRSYGMFDTGYDDYDEDVRDWMSGGSIGESRRNQMSLSEIRKQLPAHTEVTGNEKIVSLLDLTLSISKGKWIVEIEEEEIPKMEQCINCGNALFTKVEFLLGSCGECDTNMTCPNPECDEDLTAHDFMKKECGSCGQSLDLIKMLEQDTRDPLPVEAEEEDPEEIFHETVDAFYDSFGGESPAERGSEDAMVAMTTITRLDLEELASKCQRIIVDLEIGG